MMKMFLLYFFSFRRITTNYVITVPFCGYSSQIVKILNEFLRIQFAKGDMSEMTFDSVMTVRVNKQNNKGGGTFQHIAIIVYSQFEHLHICVKDVSEETFSVLFDLFNLYCLFPM